MLPRSPRHVAFGTAIRSLRQDRDVSQERLALDADMDRAYVGGIERGERNPSLANIFKIADALGVPPSEIHRRAEDIDLAGGLRLSR